MALQNMTGKLAAGWPRRRDEAASIARLAPLEPVRDNPGQLNGLFFVPDTVAGPMPLVVVLHGCTQTAEIYDRGAGWSTLAARYGFALLFPEQQRSNNPLLCFNWFSVNDTQRGMGEAASIKSMIDTMKRNHAIDPARIFVTGLSAGGAMTSVMLATYPELFEAGAILGGLAYGCASHMTEALDCMGGRTRSAADELSAVVRRASPNRGKWPRVQVWQGDADTTVTPGNADDIVRQWTGLHGLGATADVVEPVEGFPRARWLDADGSPVIEQYTITGMGHGVPIAPRRGGEQALGVSGAHMLDVGLSSTQHIAEFFGLDRPIERPAARPMDDAATAEPTKRSLATEIRTAPRPVHQRRPKATPHAQGVQAIIEKALKAAGLMR